MNVRLKKGDMLLVAALLAALLAGGFWIMGESANGGDSSVSGLVVVSQSKDGFYRADALNEDLSYTIETPGTGVGADAESGENTVRISNGTVEVESANCGNQVCVEHEPIARAGEQIVCLPHGVVVEVVAHEADAAALM